MYQSRELKMPEKNGTVGLLCHQSGVIDLAKEQHRSSRKIAVKQQKNVHNTHTRGWNVSFNLLFIIYKDH